MGKEELNEQINRLPLFETRQIAIHTNESWLPQPKFQAIVEQGKTEAIAVLRKGYVLIQLRDALQKVVEKMPETIEGRVFYYHGRAALSIYPQNEDIGIYALNSVDGTTALRVDFTIRGEDFSVFIPRKVAGLRRIHRGKAYAEYVNFLDFIEQVKETWKSIVEKLSNRIATDEDKKTFAGIIGKRGAEELDLWLKQKPTATVWDLTRQTLKIINRRKYKTEIHRNEKIRRVSFAIFAYALKS